MESTQSPARVSGSFLILTVCSVIGIVASLFLSGYLAIVLGTLAIVLLLVTQQPESRRQRGIVWLLSGLSVALGFGAVCLGMVAQALTGG